MKSSTRTQGGFTIVELLIVIVVIGILSSITVIAYGGVQQRAKNTATISAASRWAQVMAAHYTAYGEFIPTDKTSLQDHFGVCLGSTATYPETQLLAEGECGTCDSCGGSAMTINPEINSALSRIATGPSNADLARTIIRNDPSEEIYRGIWYTTVYGGGAWGTSTGGVRYVLLGTNQNCGPGNQVDYWDTGTLCDLRITAEQWPFKA